LQFSLQVASPETFGYTLYRTLAVNSEPLKAVCTELHYECYLLTHSLTHSLHSAGYYWIADCHSARQKYPAFFMEHEGSLPCSQKPAYWTLS